jgi:hypothetical protein
MTVGDVYFQWQGWILTESILGSAIFCMRQRNLSFESKTLSAGIELEIWKVGCIQRLLGLKTRNCWSLKKEGFLPTERGYMASDNKVLLVIKDPGKEEETDSLLCKGVRGCNLLDSVGSFICLHYSIKFRLYSRVAINKTICRSCLWTLFIPVLR